MGKILMKLIERYNRVVAEQKWWIAYHKKTI